MHEQLLWLFLPHIPYGQIYKEIIIWLSPLEETLAGMESESNGDLVEETEEANSGKNVWMIAAVIMVVLLLGVACCLVLRNGKRKE